LKLTEAGRWQAGAPICPIVLGATLSDHADRLQAQAFSAGPVAQPVLLIAFAARAARFLKRALRLDLAGSQFVLTEAGDPVCDLSSVGIADLSDVRCEVLPERLVHSPAQVLAAKPASTGGIAVDPTSGVRLSTYVHRTYVPASERSRREGAGAGLIDND
jgi:hypothetical protein